MPVSSVQYGQVPWHYANGLGLSNDATTPNTLLDVATGSILDSTANYQVTLSTAVKINSANNGLNGLDTGAIAASTVYAVYLVGDPVDQNTTGAMISTSLTGPLLPFGYSVFALIGFVVTDGSKNFLKGYWSAGNSTTRIFTYDAPIAALTVSSSSPATYTGLALTAYVPAVNNTPVVIQSNLSANAAADTLNMQGYNSTGDAVTIIAQVAGSSAHLESYNTVLAQLNTAAPSIKYKTSASTDTYVLSVAAFTFYI